MTQHDDNLPVEHTIIAAKAVLRWTAGRDRQSLIDDDLLLAGVERNLLKIGEASRRLSPAFREAHPSMPWPQIIALRNVVAHEYDRVDVAQLWRVINDDLQPLIDYLESLPPEDA